MKIGYDAKRAFQNFTGLGNYSRTLIETLTTHFPENEYHLFTPKLSDLPRVLKVVEHPSIQIHTPQGFWQNLKAMWRSYGIHQDLSDSKIQIFHGLSHELPLSIPPKIRMVVTIHDLIHERYPHFYPFVDRRIYSLKFKRACQQADIVVAISEQTKQDIIDFYGIEPTKIQVIYQSCDPIFYKNRLYTEGVALRKKYGLPSDFMLYVGTINERKNLLAVVKALQVIENQRAINLVAIGDGGAYFQNVKKEVANLGLEKRVVFIPEIDFADLPTIYKEARLFILPSFFEGFGIPIIEALWSGTPVITSDGSCFPEAGGADSLYINPYDSEAIAEAIEQVWYDEQLREQMILRGGQFVQKFKDKKIGQEWIELYQSLL